MKYAPLKQPGSMKTRAYVYGVERPNGYGGGKLFVAYEVGDLTKARSQLPNQETSMRFCGEPQTHERSSDALSDNPLRWSVTAR